LFIVVQGEFYICDNKELWYFWDYKEVSRKHNLDRKKDFINVITKREINRYENDISAGKGDTLDGIPMAGRSFVKYDVVKKLGVYPEKKILQFEEKLQKVKVI